MKLSFKEWLRLKETTTSTACVANYARPVFADPVRRTWPSLWGDEDRRKKKKKVV